MAADKCAESSSHPVQGSLWSILQDLVHSAESLLLKLDAAVVEASSAREAMFLYLQVRECKGRLSQRWYT
jgi:hypothetical protein